MQKSSIFFKIVFSVGVILMLGFVASGLAKLLAFFNTGSDRTTMLNIVPEIPNEYTPSLKWLDDDPQTGRPMEEFNRGIIARDYIRALYQRNLGLLTADSAGIKDYYTVDARPKVYALLTSYEKDKKAIEKAEINHNLKLHFYSADGQIASFTDFFVESRQRVIDLNTKERIFSDIDTANYQVLMLLDDGYWRIKHLVKEKISSLPDSLTLEELYERNKIQYIDKIKKCRGINYYPKDTPWKDFWLNYDEKIIEADLKIIKGLKLNTVRVFINFEQFGKGNVVPEMVERLKHFLDTAEKEKIGVVITLFDFNSNYQLLNFPATDRQLEVLLTTFRSHKAILAWDLKNEPDLDFYYQNEADVKEWLTFIIRQAKKYDPFHPITIGWAYTENADLYSNQLDFVSFHYYKKVEDLDSAIKTLKSKTKNKTLLLEEFGLASYESKVFPFSTSQNQQAIHLLEIKKILEKNDNLPFIYWTLYDFRNVAGDIAGAKPWQKNTQKHFGLIDSDDNLKKVAHVISGKTNAISKTWLDYIPSYLFTYLIIGVIFATFLLYVSSFIKKYLNRYIK